MSRWCTDQDRLQRLGEVSLRQAALGRRSSPIGLGLGARSPQETAVAVADEIITAQ
ncbi:XdhC family protein [Streptomyces sulphureus]|uniref:XdhC family protein n=1 Tax=Streptomyces sulphureus TaxID=47758 RepID=UPI000377DDB7|nr:XdhC family protein [Streptomyces sulphureus]